MARLRRDCIVQLTALLALAFAAPGSAQEASYLYDRPTLVLDPGMHTAAVTHADVDATGRYAATGSFDKTVRVWSVEDGRPQRTIRLPAGPGGVGKVYAVAISPDGEVIAAGGWTRWTEGDPQDQIYLFDRATGTMVKRIGRLPDLVFHLTFSTDGRYLAATLAGPNGLRVFDRDAAWAEVAHDSDYTEESYGADFSVDGRLTTTSYDGHVRLYDPSFRRIAKDRTAGGGHPYGIAFSPNGTKLAIGYYDSTAVDLLDGRTLAPLASPDTDGMDNGNLTDVAWSADGHTLFAGGSFSREHINPVVGWADAGVGARRESTAGGNTIMTLAPLPNNDMLVAAGDPYLAVLNPDGSTSWAQTPRQAEFRGPRVLERQREYSRRREQGSAASSVSSAVVVWGLALAGLVLPDHHVRRPIRAALAVASCAGGLDHEAALERQRAAPWPQVAARAAPQAGCADQRALGPSGWIGRQLRLRGGRSSDPGRAPCARS